MARSLNALLLAILLAATLTAQAQTGNTATSDEEPEQRWYQVELLIFEQKSDPDAIRETWPENIALAYPLNWTLLQTMDEYEQQQLQLQQDLEAEHETLFGDPQATTDNDEASAGEQAAQSNEQTPDVATAEEQENTGETVSEIPFILLDDSHKSLLDTAKRLQRKRQRVLFHSSWRQPFIQNDPEIPASIVIRGGQRYDDHHELEGSVALKLSRYLHLHTNLWFTRFTYNSGDNESLWPELPTPPDQLTLDENSLFANGKSTTSTDGFNLKLDAPGTDNLDQVFVADEIVLVKQSRRMRSKEIHYLDHPRIGLLIVLTPYELETNNNAEDNTDLQAVLAQ